MRRFTERLTRWSGLVPLSGLGVGCLLGSLATLKWLALPRQDLVLTALCCGFLCLLAVLTLLTLLRAVLLLLQLRRLGPTTATTLEAERAAPLPLPVPLWRWFPLVALQWTWQQPRADVQLDTREVVTPGKRGVYSQLTREWQVGDTFGLTRLRWCTRRSQQLRVLPSRGQIVEQPLTAHLSGGEELSDPRGPATGDRVDMRQYTRGDSPRTILWKVFARTRRLMVRIPERAVAPRPRVLLLLATSPKDEAAAAVCRVLLEGNLLGADWRFAAEGVDVWEHALQPALDALIQSGNQPGSRATLPDALRAAAADGYGQCLVAVPLDRAGDTALRDLLAAAPLPVQVCLALDGEPPRRARWKRTPDPLMQAAVRCWRAFPRPVMLLDRRNGRTLGSLQGWKP